MRYSFVTTAIVLLALSGGRTTRAYAAPAPTRVAADDTVPARWGTSRGLFEKRLTFRPKYLVQLFAGSREQPAPVQVEVVRPTERATAWAYARQYGIDESLALTIIKAAAAEGLDPELGFRLVRVESVFDVDARGVSGALGLTQLMPSTARALDPSVRTEAQILDPATNLRLGFRYLRDMIDQFDGDVRLGVLAYNRGETAVIRALRRGSDPENGYSRKVLGLGGRLYTGDGTTR